MALLLYQCPLLDIYTDKLCMKANLLKHAMEAFAPTVITAVTFPFVFWIIFSKNI